VKAPILKKTRNNSQYCLKIGFIVNLAAYRPDSKGDKIEKADCKLM
jgi:hypothetical protein